MGRACGVSRPVIAASILSGSGPNVEGSLKTVRSQIEQLLA